MKKYFVFIFATTFLLTSNVAFGAEKKEQEEEPLPFFENADEYFLATPAIEESGIKKVVVVKQTKKPAEQPKKEQRETAYSERTDVSAPRPDYSSVARSYNTPGYHQSYYQAPSKPAPRKKKKQTSSSNSAAMNRIYERTNEMFDNLEHRYRRTRRSANNSMDRINQRTKELFKKIERDRR